ncbi:MAG: PQQ-dependent sugar dehydrogenase [Sulfurifustaceae bacterium]
MAPAARRRPVRNPLRVFAALFLCVGMPAFAALPLDRLKLPADFTIAVYAEHVDDARALALGPDGTVYVGSLRAGSVYALLPDRNHDGRADEVVVLARGLNGPNGVDVHDGALYVAENHRIIRFPDIARHLRTPPKPEVVYDKLPTETHHGWRFARFGPDGKLYVAIGAPCNVCQRDPDRYALIERLNADGGALDVYARGIRNSVGFDWQPQTSALWFTDNGRDLLGDNVPPDELNRAARPGLNFGFPFCHGGDIPDPELGKRRTCSDFTAPAVKLAPHTAALGMRFYTAQQFPARYRNGVFIAEHGSWNRTEPIGYRVTFIPFVNGEPAGYEVFAQGWLQSGQAWGRPVDVLVMPDGALLVSDDRAGVVYRIAVSGR